MAREEQNRVLDLIEQVTDGAIQREACPDWLRRPGKSECGDIWPQVCEIYGRLTGMELPLSMPPRERRSLDAISTDDMGRPRIIEYDEDQHFNRYRAATFHGYLNSTLTAYDRSVWAQRCRSYEVINGGGFSKPRPPLFPMDGGRNYQRAFRDMLADLLPPLYRWQPTMRVGYFEVRSWLHAPDAVQRMRVLVENKTQTTN